MPNSPGLAIHRFAHEAMATIFEIFIAGRDGKYARQAARAVFDEVDRLERLFSRFDPSSEISRISRLAPGERMMIGIETVECLSLAAGIQAATKGAFNINFRAVSARPSRTSRRPTAPSGRAAGKRSPLPGDRRTAARGSLPPGLLDLVRLERAEAGFEVVRLAGGPGKIAAPLDLDLGGVGKGYALDRALEVLEEWSIANALLHSGTSTAIGIGPGPDPCREERGWPVGAATAWDCPRAPKEVRLRNRALSGSGTEVKGSHIIDPRSGRPASGHLAAWAAHPSAAVADALSTAFLVMTTGEVERTCRSRPDVWALVIPAPKKCRMFHAALIA
jgi:thiamine biosynthesis lipoprotein